MGSATPPAGFVTHEARAPDGSIALPVSHGDLGRIQGYILRFAQPGG
ncbi:MAG: hypothetical protein ACOC6J_10495 [Spirochaetota bacterium]